MRNRLLIHFRKKYRNYLDFLKSNEEEDIEGFADITPLPLETINQPTESDAATQTKVIKREDKKTQVYRNVDFDVKVSNI